MWRIGLLGGGVLDCSSYFFLNRHFCIFKLDLFCNSRLLILIFINNFYLFSLHHFFYFLFLLCLTLCKILSPTVFLTFCLIFCFGHLRFLWWDILSLFKLHFLITSLFCVLLFLRILHHVVLRHFLRLLVFSFHLRLLFVLFFVQIPVLVVSLLVFLTFPVLF